MLKGIFPVLPTCFTSKGALNYDEQSKVIEFAISSGAHGLVYPGVASEYNFLSREERNALLEHLSLQVDKRIPVIIGISASTIAEVIALAEDAMKHGVFHFMLMAPADLGADLGRQGAFFHDILEALPPVEIILQNAPAPIGAGLAADQLVEIIKTHSNISYIKEETLPSGPTITAILDQKIAHLSGVFGGGGARYIIDELNRGAVGAVPAVELVDLHVKLFNAYQQQDLQEARRLYRLSLPLLTAQKIYRMKLTKYVLKERGVCEALFVRAPSLDLDNQARFDIDSMLEELHQESVWA